MYPLLFFVLAKIEAHNLVGFVYQKKLTTQRLGEVGPLLPARVSNVCPVYALHRIADECISRKVY